MRTRKRSGKRKRNSDDAKGTGIPERAGRADDLVCGGAGGADRMAAGRERAGFWTEERAGQGIDAKDAVIDGAIVYLENKRNNNIKTFISTSDGSYRFADLAADTDYSLWAAYHGKKSSQKTVSSFDTRKQINIDLKIK